MRGGGGRQPSYAASDGADADAAAVPAASRKMVQSLKGILADRSEGEIYATLCDCGMDPDIAVERLISQDTFHEVRRKRDKKKETKVNQETRPRPFQKSIYGGYKAGSDRSGRDSIGGFKGPAKKEPELHASINSSALDVNTSATSETFSATGNVAQADAKNTFQPPSQVKHGWGGVPGRPSMAEIVKMGRPQAKVGSRSVASSIVMPAIGDSAIPNTPNLAPNEYNQTVFASEVGHGAADKLPNVADEVHSVSKDASSLDMLPSAEGTDVEAPSMSANMQGSSTPDANEDDVEKDTNLEEGNTESLTTPGQVSASGKGIHSEYTELVSHLDEGSMEKTDDFQLDALSFEHNLNLNGDVSTTTTQFDHLTLLDGPKLSDENPAVIIPGHLQVSNADCAHLTFGSFVYGTLDASLTTKPLESHGDIVTIPDDDYDQSEGRIHDDESKVTLAPAANEYVTSTSNSNVENLDITSVQQSEVTRSNFLDVTSNTEYNLSSPPDYATSSAALQDSTSQSYLQENRQFQSISPLPSFMQIQNGLMSPAIPPLREFDPAFSLLLTNPPIMHGTTSSSMSSATVSTQPQENANPVGLPNPQLTQSQPSTSIAPGPPLPQHLLHPYAQTTLPLGYASMIGYPSLPPSYAYLPPAAFQQPYMNSGMFLHQAAAAVPNSSVKYPLPQYKSNIALASLPQPGSLLSSYVGGFGTANNMPGNFPLNQSTTSATATLGFDGTVPSHLEDGNQFVCLQQNENPAMWMHGAGSRGMPPLAASTMYGYQGQSHQTGLRQGQLPSQYGSALGQSQPGLGPEHRNPSDSNLSGAAQANQMWPNSY
ncbi:Putative DUF1296 domain containing family protein [Zea mays]|uniref:Putative DUF1296 domain containing family protein n=2 Tax=Zea mays TaxID=4577 RepID=A0A1D6FL54_MAIZE|nr:Putative DUF1296 domain containing family protein [Zea mays]